MSRLFLFLGFFMLVAPFARAQDAKPDAKIDLQQTFTAANALLDQKKYAEALAEYRKILAVAPDLDGPLRNGAMAAFYAGDYKTSADCYQKVKATTPSDGFVRSKLVEVYQAMGDEKARDTERTDLIAMHNAGKDTSALAKRTEFCRDIYDIGPHHILVYEPFVFTPHVQGHFAARYQFVVFDEAGKQEVRIEVGWDAAIKDAQGIYQPDKTTGFYFDTYYPTGPMARLTMGVFDHEFSYSEAKAHVQAIVEGKVKATGGTPRQTPPTDAKPATP